MGHKPACLEPCWQVEPAVLIPSMSMMPENLSATPSFPSSPSFGKSSLARTNGFSSCKVFYTTPEVASMENPYNKRPGYDGCFAFQEKGHVLKDCPYVKVSQKMQNMGNKKPFSKFQQKVLV
ncbi:hypothetical protein DSO57_1032402 [Entomophthora muscae]|uniref:Uncharacterized protein n=1 Tax=Entomophthora muscae TaxID=34485 RepID=A0ACC2RRB5_9FUNG|nr:hypothetical protein DSO57_1032402 [Entomophthora muscae]